MMEPPMFAWERVDAWFHPGLLPTPDARRQARLMFSISAALLLGGLLVLVQHVRLGNLTLALRFGVMVALGLGTVLSFRWLRSLKLVANLVPLQVFLGVTIINLSNDGLGYPSYFALVLAPQAGFLLAGARSGSVFGALALLEMVALAWLHPDPSGVSRRPGWASLELVGGVAFLFSVAGLTWAYESLKNNTLRELVAERVRADQASAAMSEFLANVSHEIRTPMNGVLGMLELLQSDLQGEHRAMAGTAVRSARSLLALLGDVLDMSKLEAGAMELEARPVDLVELTSGAAALFEEAARAKGLTLRVEAPGWAPLVLGDPVRLRQVLHNLLGNALKFTSAGGVTVGLEAATRAGAVDVRVAVTDTGCGIPPERLEVIFERFRQADGSTTRRFGGTGLGLAISRDLAARMGGALTVESALGAGARFTLSLRLPLAPAAASARSLESGDVPPKALLQGLGPVLVVEDEPVNRLVCTKMLERLGVSYRAVEHGQQALDALGEAPFKLVLMDCHMPVMDGFEATRRIRKLGGVQAKVPIVALTALAVVGDREACLAAGMDDFLSKPVSQVALAQMVARYAAKYR
jgi:signal transduction histidine kinase/CheY-like chemotaxis protein